MNLLPGATFIATLAIAVPVWAEGVEINVVTPSTVQRPPPRAQRRRSAQTTDSNLSERWR